MVELPPLVGSRVGAYLDMVDEVLPGRVEGFYLVGSVALGGFRPGRSDIDFVAIVADGTRSPDWARLRRSQRRLYDLELVRALPRLQWPLVCNGTYVRSDDLGRPPAEATAVASHVARQFHVASAFDVNPVTWRELATKGIAVRGRPIDQLTVHDDDRDLRAWNRTNLDTYWRAWAESLRRAGIPALRLALKHTGTAWGALGVSRLHYTIATGDIATKEEAGEYALDVFDCQWHPLLLGALAYWRGHGSPFSPAISPRRRTAAFVAMVIEAGLALPH